MDPINIQEEFHINVKLFLKSIKECRDLEDKTIKAYSSDLQQFYMWIDEKGLEYIDTNTINLYVDYLRHDKKLKHSSIRRKIVCLRSYFQYLYKDVSFFNGIKIKNIKNSSPKTPKTLSIDEVIKMFKTIESNLFNLDGQQRTICIRDAAIIGLLFFTGILIGELSKIQMKDVDFNEKTIFINGKGNKERILCISNEELLNKLSAWIDVRYLLYPNNNYFFINRFGERLSIFGIEKIFFKYRDLSGIDCEATPYSFRHTFATCLIENGANIKDVQTFLGHSNISTTEVYHKKVLEGKKGFSLFNPINHIDLNEKRKN